MSEHAAAPAAAPSCAPRTYRAIYFDLDGTLLPMELEEFLGAYFKSLCDYMAKRGVPKEVFFPALKAGIGAMMVHDDNRLNAEVFWEAFLPAMRAVDAERDWQRVFASFYEGPFKEIGANVTPNPATVRAIAALAEKGYPLVVATMPLFPLTAVRTRLGWAGLDPDAFCRITNFENSTSVKPKLAFYEENLRAAGLAGAEALMVGNNTEEDLACLGCGMDAFLVTDHMLDPVSFDLSTVKHGSMEEFAAWAEALPACENPAQGIEMGPVAPARAVEGE